MLHICAFGYIAIYTQRNLLSIHLTRKSSTAYLHPDSVPTCSPHSVTMSSTMWSIIFIYCSFKAISLQQMTCFHILLLQNFVFLCPYYYHKCGLCHFSWLLCGLFLPDGYEKNPRLKISIFIKKFMLRGYHMENLFLPPKILFFPFVIFFSHGRRVNWAEG